MGMDCSSSSTPGGCLGDLASTAALVAGAALNDTLQDQAVDYLGQEGEDGAVGRNIYPRFATIIASIASIILILMGVSGNLLTILALCRSVKLRLHATTVFVISLCASDLLFCTINLPLTASRYIHEAWVLGDALCSIFPFFFYGNVAASLMNMVAITVNRYILIAHHGVYDRIYRRRYIYCMVALIWAFSFGMMIPPLVGAWGRLGLDPPTFSCTILKKDGRSPKKFLFLLGFLLPCVVIIVCYSAIYYKVRQSRRNLAAHKNPGSAGSPTSQSSGSTYTAQVARKEDLRLTRMMLTIFCCFLLCFLPLMIVNVADDDVAFPSIHVLASVLAWASAVINPFVYAVTNRQYRAAYRKLLCGHRKRKAARSSNSHSKSNSSRTLMTEFQYHAATGKVTSPVLTDQDPN